MRIRSKCIPLKFGLWMGLELGFGQLEKFEANVLYFIALLG